MGKLVRDKIIDIIKSEGRRPYYFYLNNEEYISALLDKVEEEANEVRSSFSPGNLLEELADLQEVVDHLIKAFGYTKEEVTKAQNKKRKKCGGFKKRIFLQGQE